MSSQSAPPPPNYAPIAAASEKQSELAAQQMAVQNQIAQDQLAWAKQQYADNKPITDALVHSFLDAQEMGKTIQQKGLDAFDQNQANAAQDRARYVGLYQPLENDLVRDAQSYLDPSKRAAAMGKAEAGVGQAFDAARASATRELEGFGINPSATRYAGLDIGLRANEAAAKAAAGTNAGERFDATGRALRSEAINVGRGYPGQVVNSYGAAVGAGNLGVGAGSMGINAGGAGSNALNQGFGTASNAFTAPGVYTGQATNSLNAGTNAIGQWGNIVNSGYQNQLAAFNANQNASSGIGSVLGLGAALAKPFLFAARGGAISDVEGEVPTEMSPTRGGAIDDVPARLTAGEFVLPKDTVSWLGEEKLHKLIEKARNARAETEQRTGAIPDVHPADMADAIHQRAMPRRQAIPQG